jgi:Putative bacterial sensory transduction regulator
MTWINWTMRGAVALAAAGFFALPAAAQTYQPVTPDEVAEVLKSQGLTATIDPRKDGDGEYVNSIYNNMNFWVHFDGCDNAGANCTDIVFDAGFSFKDNADRPALDEINDWNEHNLGKAGIDKDGNPWINIEVNILGGVTRANLVETLRQWQVMLKDFTASVGWGKH